MLPIASGWGAMGAVAIVEDCSGMLMIAGDDSVNTVGTKGNFVDFVGSMEPTVESSMLRVAIELSVGS